MATAAQHSSRCRASTTLFVLLSLLHALCHHASIVAATRHRDESNQIIDQFTPPKLSFTASDYFASIANDNIVKSIQDEGVVATSDSNTSEVEPWKIFQAVSSLTSKEAILRRSGPLLTLFPKSSNDNMNDKNFEYFNLQGHSYATHSVYTPSEQRSYLELHGKQCHSGDVLSRYDLFVKSPTLSNLAIELWKYCALYVEGGVYVDAETAPLAALGDVLGWDGNQPSGYDTAETTTTMKNYAVVATTRDSGVSPRLISSNSRISDAVTSATSHGTGNPIAVSSMLAISTKHHSVPERMIGTLMLTSTDVLESDALLLPKALMSFINEDNKARSGETAATPNWGLLKQRCNGIEIAPAGYGNGQPRTLRHCPLSSGYCCEILDPTSSFVFLLSRQSLVPNQLLPSSSKLPRPYAENHNASANGTGTAINAVVPEKEVAFLSTIREDLSSPLLQSSSASSSSTYAPGNSDTTPNIYELLSRENALPNQEKNKQACMDCLREKKAANCELCSEKCPKFCSKLCELNKTEKPVKRVLSVVGPKYRKDPERWIPRIIHQTWFEPVTAEKYPNMSRLIESWKRSGWEYHFWDDTSAAEFLSLHFPPEVREAYESIIPGAFKADLFRYCVLLIMGGIYADMDVMLESNLDAAVPPDVGFMTPVDAPGTRPDRRMCLWNGFIASAPAHPYLSRAIQHVVNNIRNRFTVVDYDHMMCPTPELSVVHAFSTLFTAGPCILGLTVNEVMGRDLQQTFAEGDLDGADSVNGVPGRTIILQQNKWDMGAHRFTWVENNLVIAATDMPDYDDRKELEGDDKEQATHYSKTLDRNSIYGEGKVYINREIAHERIIMSTHVDSSY